MKHLIKISLALEGFDPEKKWDLAKFGIIRGAFSCRLTS